MAYSYVNLTSSLALLAGRLYDPNMVFWSAAELTAYIQQSIRTFGSLASFWRGEFTFDTVSGTTWYDITDIAVAPNTLRPLTVTDQNLVNLIQYHLLEPISGTYPLSWTGSSQFTLSDILGAIQRKRDEILSMTGCNLTQRNVAAVPGRTFLPDTVIDVRRVAWLPAVSGYTNTPLLPSDEWDLQSFSDGFEQESGGNPNSYKQSTEPPLSFDVDFQPPVPGQYDVLSVDAGSTLTTASSSLLSIPDDYTWVIVFGALSELLNRDSNARDSLRAQYCDVRYRQGLALLMSSPAILYARILNTTMDVDSVQNQDNFNNGWQATSGQPSSLLTAGLNLVAGNSIPNASYQILLGVVQNAPIPVNGTDYLQVGRDDLDAILDYAQHLASFKMGGLEFLSTSPLLQNFHRVAAGYNDKLNELGEFTKPMFEMSQLQAQAAPVFESDQSKQ